MNNTLTVTQINQYIKSIIEQDKNLDNILMVGEISNFTNHYSSGHFYFTLKDEKSSIKAVMFKSYASNVDFTPKNGMKVLVRGKINVYVNNGNYQILCTEIVPHGLGSQDIAFNEIKNKLEEKGYFDLKNKKEINQNPDVIGVITSKDAAALQDVLSVIGRRNPFSKVIIIPAIMQGSLSSTSVIDAIDLAEKNSEIDVILIARGGGSKEDLWSFNSEKLAERVFICEKPVISAIGHEVDVTILDFVADIRAATPSVAAELLVSDIRSINFHNYYNELKIIFYNNLNYFDNKLKQIEDKNIVKKFNDYLASLEYKLNSLKTEIDYNLNNSLNYKENKFNNLVKVFDAINVMSILDRGYCIIKKDNESIKSISNVKKGDEITLLISDGKIISTITDIKKEVF
ncbi:MAG: exodeoxyribonuclease VII large subunit [Oscillospiraceae bacterium]